MKNPGTVLTLALTFEPGTELSVQQLEGGPKLRVTLGDGLLPRELALTQAEARALAFALTGADVGA